jgi:hypothetical protein
MPTTPDTLPLDSAISCGKCHYVLRGLHRDGVCPECGHAVAQSIKARELHSSRWSGWILIGSVLAALSFVSFSALTCGCHFQPGGLVASLVLPLWSFWPLLNYRTRGEQIAAWVIFLTAMIWLGFSVKANGLN